MIQALVLIEAEPTRVQELVQELQDLKLADSVIKQVYGVTGRYDLVALVESPDLQALGNWVTTGIANAVGVRRTETCLVVWYAQGETSAALTQTPGAASTPTIASAPAPAVVSGSVYGADAFYDAGSKGCADGPVDDIAALMRKLSPGQTLEIHATDASLAVDLAAWCRLTGNTLLEQRGARYLVRRS